MINWKFSSQGLGSNPRHDFFLIFKLNFLCNIMYSNCLNNIQIFNHNVNFAFNFFGWSKTNDCTKWKYIFENEKIYRMTNRSKALYIAIFHNVPLGIHYTPRDITKIAIHTSFDKLWIQYLEKSLHWNTSSVS